MVAQGTALWESLVGKPPEIATDTYMKRDAAATPRKESGRVCSHSRRGLTPMWRFQKYPKIHVSIED